MVNLKISMRKSIDMVFLIFTIFCVCVFYQICVYINRRERIKNRIPHKKKVVFERRSIPDIDEKMQLVNESAAINNQNYIEKIDQVLKDLEDKGEVMLISTNPKYIPKFIFHSIVEEMLKDRYSDFLIESDIPYLLERVAQEVSLIFSEDIKNAERIANEFYHKLLYRYTMVQVAEIIHHETPFEIALRAFYSIELKNIDNRDFNYLDWRKQYYMKLRG